ncbi:MAG: imidazolonepropionase [Brevefilum sp.]|nr:imidazolonepropionase [Brevefilum sp.]
MIVHHAGQLLTLAGGPQRGQALGDLGLIEQGAVVIQGAQILAVGRSTDLLKAYPQAERFDAHGKIVMPGFVDPHTHLVWAGDRADEFTLRLEGKTYMEILAMGGGILSTVRATRAASIEELVSQTRPRAREAFRHGTTTMEVKTGYGLTLESEIKQLQAILALNREGPMELVPTFLGAHAVPPEYQGRTEAYVDLLCKEMLPGIHDWWYHEVPDQRLPFVDVFCERGAFDLAQSRRILEAAQGLGFPLKIHADEFENLGGAALAAELGAASADHLVKTSPDDIRALASSQTVAVSLPGTPFGLNEAEYTPAQAILQAGGTLALATDINPGTSWCESMQFILALACRKMRLTPAQAIAAATINAAAALQRQDTLGSIEPGKQADLLILDVNHYQHLGYRFGTNLVSHVIKQGRIYPVN